jgi:hypothetical protein
VKCTYTAAVATAMIFGIQVAYAQVVTPPKSPVVAPPGGAGPPFFPFASGENLTFGTLAIPSKSAQTLACSRYHPLRSHH